MHSYSDYVINVCVFCTLYVFLIEKAFPSGMPGSSISSYILLYKLGAKYMEIIVALLWATDKEIKTKQHPFCFGICINIVSCLFCLFLFFINSKLIK